MTIREAFERFLAEKGTGDPGSASSPSSIIRLFADFLNEVGYLSFALEDWSFPTKRLDTSRPFCDVYGPEHIDALTLSVFVNDSVRRRLEGDEPALTACRDVMTDLVAWFVESGFWDGAKAGELASPLVRCLVSDLCARHAFCRILYDYVDKHPVDAPEALADHDHFDGKFIILKVEPGKLYLDFVGGPLSHASVDWSFMDARDPAPELQTDVVLTLPREITDKARRGWNLIMRTARVQGRWRIIEVQNVDE